MSDDRCRSHIGHMGEHIKDCPWCQIENLQAENQQLKDNLAEVTRELAVYKETLSIPLDAWANTICQQTVEETLKELQIIRKDYTDTSIVDRALAAIRKRFEVRG